MAEIISQKRNSDFGFQFHTIWENEDFLPEKLEKEIANFWGPQSLKTSVPMARIMEGI
jgi:hypothetical protein